VGEGSRIVLAHGLTATRRYLVHGSLLLARRGLRMISYDARGHGRSDAPPAAQGYEYSELAGDLASVAGAEAGDGRFVLAGHSMGAHTALAYALEHPERVAAIVVIGPTYVGVIDDDSLARWDRLASALEAGGLDGFIEANVQGLDPSWQDTVRRFTRERMLAHRDLGEMVRALREVPRSRPFETMSELAFLEVPVLVVASHDVADPSHPYAVAEAYAQAMPAARLISEEEGHSPLAWQGGRLSREIVAFCEEPQVAERL
jgi:pimeloyl-ACP methyl ester carboxylesterase